jgi:hypothetical protein
MISMSDSWRARKLTAIPILRQHVGRPLRLHPHPPLPARLRRQAPLRTHATTAAAAAAAAAAVQPVVFRHPSRRARALGRLPPGRSRHGRAPAPHRRRPAGPLRLGLREPAGPGLVAGPASAIPAGRADGRILPTGVPLLRAAPRLLAAVVSGRAVRRRVRAAGAGQAALRGRVRHMGEARCGDV